MNRARDRRFLLALLGLLLLGMAVPNTAWAYLSDLAGHWSAAVVAALEARSIVEGVAPDRFEPDSALTRAQLAKLFVVGLGYEAEASQLSRHPSRFTDVPNWHWGRGYIEVLAELGLTEGTTEGQFGPDEPVTRAQLALFLVRGAALTDQANRRQAEASPYHDDGEIPDWGRGAVVTARSEGLMLGLPEGRFDPNRAVTRAEGSAALFRLLNRKGSLFHLSGTLVEYNARNRTGKVRDALGQERSFELGRTATYLRQGEPAPAGSIRPLDQVWVVLNDKGEGLLLEAWYQDLLLRQVSLQGRELVFTLPTGERASYPVQPGALIFLNGRPAPLEEVLAVSPLYAALDTATNEIRLLAGLRAPREGRLINPWVEDDLASVQFGAQAEQLRWADEPVIRLNGRPAELHELRAGDQLLLAFDEAGRISYVEVTR